MDIKYWTEKLRAADLYVVDDKEIAYGHQLILYEGAVINFYTNGTIMVQGKTMPYCVPGAMEHKLKRVLPAKTKYHLRSTKRKGPRMRGPLFALQERLVWNFSSVSQNTKSFRHRFKGIRLPWHYLKRTG